MKYNMRFIIFLMLIFIIVTLFPLIITHAKYYYNFDMESDVDICYMVFNIKQKDEEPETYEITKGNEIVAKYILTNKDEKNNINKLDLRYYIKILNEQEEEQSDFQIEFEGYDYIEYNIDSDGNIRDENGNIIDEEGNILEEIELTEEENTVLQNELTHIKKGFGPINLSYDGLTPNEEELLFKIKCPDDYNGDENINLKINVIGEGISNKEFTYTEEAQLNIIISEEVEDLLSDYQINTEETDLNNENIDEETNSSETIDNIDNTTNELSDSTNEISQNIIDNSKNELNNEIQDSTIDDTQDELNSNIPENIIENTLNDENNEIQDNINENIENTSSTADDE